MVKQLFWTLLFLIICSTVNAQLQKRFNVLMRDTLICDGNYVVSPGRWPISYPINIPRKPMTYYLPFKERLHIYIYCCIDTNGNIDKSTLIGARLLGKNHGDKLNILRELQPSELDSLLDVNELIKYVNQVKFKVEKIGQKKERSNYFMILGSKSSSKMMKENNQCYLRKLRIV
jgi:hypothetical protein